MSIPSLVFTVLIGRAPMMWSFRVEGFVACAAPNVARGVAPITPRAATASRGSQRVDNGATGECGSLIGFFVTAVTSLSRLCDPSFKAHPIIPCRRLPVRTCHTMTAHYSHFLSCAGYFCLLLFGVSVAYDAIEVARCARTRSDERRHGSVATDFRHFRWTFSIARRSGSASRVAAARFSDPWFRVPP